MDLPVHGALLRIIVGEQSRCQGAPLYEWIVRKAREAGVAGATAHRGMMGYGANSRIKTASILVLSDDLPVIIELIDSREILEQFMDLIDPVIREGVATLEDIHIRLYRSGQAGKPGTLPLRGSHAS